MDSLLLSCPGRPGSQTGVSDEEQRRARSRRDVVLGYAPDAAPVDAAIRGAVKPTIWTAFGRGRVEPAELNRRHTGNASEINDGRVAERFKAPVLKTGVGASSPWVRIPPLPPFGEVPFSQTECRATLCHVQLQTLSNRTTGRATLSFWCGGDGPSTLNTEPWRCRQQATASAPIETGPWRVALAYWLRLPDRPPRSPAATEAG